MFFDSLQGLWRVVVVGVLAYASLVAILRISGKRTLTKMNAFDLVITVAFGSTLATILLSQDVALLEGIVAFVVLAGAQWLVAWTSVRSDLIRRLVKSEPHLVFYRGELLDDRLRRERLTEGEVLAAIRAAGIRSLDDVDAVVLETDGSLSVMQRDGAPRATALAGVDNLDAAGDARAHGRPAPTPT